MLKNYIKKVVLKMFNVQEGGWFGGIEAFMPEVSYNQVVRRSQMAYDKVHDQERMIHNLIKQALEDRTKSEELHEAMRKEVELLKFEMKNPPKYKVGDQVKPNLIVTKVEIYESNWVGSEALFGALKYKTPEPDFRWKYTVVDKKTGKTKTI